MRPMNTAKPPHTNRSLSAWGGLRVCCFCCFLFFSPPGWGQADQGTIMGVVQDSSGAILPNAQVTLTSIDSGLVLQAKTDRGGLYTFSPIKIGNYKVTASAKGFQTTSHENLHLDVQQHLNVPLTLSVGEESQTVTVTSAAPLLGTQDSSVGQVMDTQTINDTALNGRNWVYIAQLTAGTEGTVGSRAGGKGDFEANGQRAEQNNFVLDGVDNNVNVIDFLGGSTWRCVLRRMRLLNSKSRPATTVRNLATPRVHCSMPALSPAQTRFMATRGNISGMTSWMRAISIP